MRSRHKGSRPETLSLIEVDSEGRERTRQVLVAEHPTYAALPVFEAPATIRGADTPNLMVKSAWIKLVGSSTLGEASSRLNVPKVGVAVSVDAYAFARLLGKIAHGFVAAADLGDIETELPTAMFAADESIGRWVGGAPDVTIHDHALHGVQASLVEGMVHVRIRLFAQFGGPEYLVIGGRLIKPTADMRPSVTIEGATPRVRAGRSLESGAPARSFRPSRFGVAQELVLRR